MRGAGFAAARVSGLPHDKLQDAPETQHILHSTLALAAKRAYTAS